MKTQFCLSITRIIITHVIKHLALYYKSLKSKVNIYFVSMFLLSQIHCLFEGIYDLFSSNYYNI
jgi:hypothetical protein